MRELLFRGATLTEPIIWVEGYLISPHTIRVYNQDNPEAFRESDFINYYVEVDTIGQFTGLTDQQGNRIFEGDIVMCDPVIEVYDGLFPLDPPEEKQQEILCEVIFSQGAFDLKTIEKDRHLDSWGFYHEELQEEIKIIGNKWTNPELLNAGK